MEHASIDGRQGGMAGSPARGCNSAKCPEHDVAPGLQGRDPMLATVHSASLSGIESVAVEVQAFFGKGLPGVDIVGLGDTAVRESRVRVKSALESSGLELPSRHVVLNLAPADVRKTGSGLDLAVALALLCAGGASTPASLPDYVVLGELALGGELRPVRGVLSHLR